MIWDPKTGEKWNDAGPLTGHKDYVTSLSWEPFHKNSECRYIASSSKDKTIKIWDTKMMKIVKTLSGHKNIVTKVLWGGEGLIYSSSRDLMIKVWDAKKGTPIRELKGHGHWVNTMALSTDYVIRTAWFDHKQH